MPFVFEGQLLYCRGQAGSIDYVKQPGSEELAREEIIAWQPYLCDWPTLENNIAFPIAGNSIRTCSPHLFRKEDGSLVASYVSEKPVGYLALRTRQAATFDALLRAPEVDLLGFKIFCGYFDGQYANFSEGGRQFMWQHRSYLLDGVASILRMTPFEEGMIISVTDTSGNARSVVFKSNQPLQEIICEGMPVYKCTIYDGGLIHAIRTGEFEQRELHWSDRWRLVPTTLRVR